METLIYLLKTGSLLALFFLIYELFLKRETFFVLNRFFLLVGIGIAVVLPAINFTKTIVVEKTIASALIPKSEIVSDFYFEAIPVVVENETLLSNLDWTHLLLFIYGAGVLFFLLRFVISLISLRKILETSSYSFKENGFLLMKIDCEINPFTFFKTIVYNPKLYKEEELEMILHHEKTHAKQWHSLDIILGQLLIVFQWMNPISWIYAKRMDQNLEFIADQKTTTEKVEKKSYQIRLLKSAYTGDLSLPVNNFHSFTKNRILMLNRTQSKRKNRLKILIIVPFLAVFFMSFQMKTIHQTEIVSDIIIENDSVTNEKVQTLDKIFKKYDPEAIINFNGKELKIKAIPRGVYRVEEAVFSNSKNSTLRAKLENADMKIDLTDWQVGVYIVVRESGIVVVEKDPKNKSNQVRVYKGKNTTVSEKNVRADSTDKNITVAQQSKLDDTIKVKNVKIIESSDDIIIMYDFEELNGDFRERVENALKERGRVLKETDKIREKAFAENQYYYKESGKDKELLKESKNVTILRMSEIDSLKKAAFYLREEMLKNRKHQRDSLFGNQYKIREKIRAKFQKERGKALIFEALDNISVENINGLKYIIGKNKNEEVTALRFYIDKHTTNLQFDEISKVFSESDIDFKVRKIRRNKSGEITDLKMTLNNRKGVSSRISQQDSKGIKAYTLGMKEDGEVFMVQKN